MSLLLLFSDGSPAAPDPAGNRLDLTADMFWMEAEATMEGLTGAFAVMPALSASATLTGYSILDADISVARVDCSATMSAVGILDCMAVLPALGVDAHMQQRPGLFADISLPLLEASAGVSAQSGALECEAELPCLFATALISEGATFAFPSESDSILKYEARRRLL